MASTKRDKDIAEIAAIDAKLEAALGWGSWMVGMSKERERLANKYGLPHKYLIQAIKPKAE